MNITPKSLYKYEGTSDDYEVIKVDSDEVVLVKKSSQKFVYNRLQFEKMIKDGLWIRV